MAYKLRTFNHTNPMKEPRLEKVVVNIGVGEAGEKLIKAEKVLGMVTGAKPVRTLAKKAEREWTVRKGSPLGCKVTLRGEAAEKFLRKALDVRNQQVPWFNFDDEGNLNFGLTDYTDFEGMKYDPDIGIFGMNITVAIARPGARVKRRRIRPGKVGRRHRMNLDESAAWLAKKYGAKVVD